MTPDVRTTYDVARSQTSVPVTLREATLPVDVHSQARGAFTLRLVAGGPETVVSCNGVATIGRRPDNTVVLSHPAVSRRHAEVERDGALFVVRDLESRNGLTVDGQFIQNQSFAARFGSLIALGPFLLAIGDPPSSDSETEAVQAYYGAPRLELDRALHVVRLDGRVVVSRLSALEYRLLDSLDTEGRAVVEQTALGDAIWGPDSWDLPMLHALIHRLRKKLDPTGASGEQALINVAGVGYRLA